MSDCAGVGQMQAKRLRTATDLSATVSILHGYDYVGRAGLFGASRGIDQRGDLA